MAQSSHKILKNAHKLLHAVERGETIVPKTKNKLAKVVLMPLETTVHQSRLSIAKSRTISERTEKIHPVYNRKLLELFLYDDIFVDYGSKS